jgi:hypothetical protein
LTPTWGVTEEHVEQLRSWLPGQAAQAVLHEENLQRMEARWGVLTATEARSRTGSNRDPRTSWLLGVRRPHGFVYPRFQLVGDTSRIAPAWTEVCDLLAPAEWSDENVLIWAAAVNGWLEGRSPAEEIQSHPERATDALRLAIDRAIPDVTKKRWAERTAEPDQY